MSPSYHLSVGDFSVPVMAPKLLYKTRDIEGAVRIMASRYDTVLIRSDCRLQKKIRLRPKLIQDLNPYVVSWSSGAKYLEEWKAKGGVMNYKIAPGTTNNLPKHDSQVIVEMPMSPRKYDQATEATTDCVVIYQPPTWDGHREAVADRNPHEDVAAAYWVKLVKAQSDRALCEAVEIPVGRVVNEDDIRRELFLRIDQFRSLRRALFKKEQWHQIRKIALRMRPGAGSLGEVYGYLEHCPHIAGYHVVLDDELKRADRFWKAALRILAKHGYISIKESATVYYLGPEPQWDKVAARRTRAEAELEAMIRQTESLAHLQTLSPAPAPS